MWKAVIILNAVLSRKREYAFDISYQWENILAVIDIKESTFSGPEIENAQRLFYVVSRKSVWLVRLSANHIERDLHLFES